MEGVSVVIWLLIAMALLQGVILAVLWMRGDGRYETLQSQADWLQDQLEEMSVKPDEPVRLKRFDAPSSRDGLRKYAAALQRENRTLTERIEQMREARECRKRTEATQPPDTEVAADTQR